jgi:hypothetical protein
LTSGTGSNQQGSAEQRRDKAGDQHGADQHHVDQHKERVKFAEVEATAQTDGQFTVQWAADGRSVTIKGRCPACGGLTSTEFPFGIASSKGFRGPPKPRPAILPSPVTIYCECGHAHEDRPPDAIDTGCGRFWAVHLTDAERRPTLPGPAEGQTRGSAHESPRGPAQGSPQP